MTKLGKPTIMRTPERSPDAIAGSGAAPREMREYSRNESAPGLFRRQVVELRPKRTAARAAAGQSPRGNF